MRVLAVALLLVALAAGAGPAEAPSPARRLPTGELGAGSVGFQVFGKEHGLSGATVTALNRDGEGFLWAGTEEDGIYRLEGRRWQRLETKAFRGVVLDGLLPAWPRGLWVMSRAGIFLQDGMTATPLLQVPGLPQGAWQTATAVRQLGLLLVAPREGRLAVQTERHGWQVVAAPPGLGTPAVAAGDPELRRLVLDDGQNLWVRLEGRWERLAGRPQATLRELLVDRAGDLWLRTQDGLFHARDCRGTVTAVRLDRPLSAPQFSTLVQDHAGRLWTNTADGLMWFHGPRQGFIGRLDGLPRGAGILVATDAQGGLWSGGAGVCRLLGDLQWENWGLDRGLPSEEVWSVHRGPDGRLWVATAQGVARMTPRGLIPVSGGDHDIISCLVTDREGRLWASRRADRPGKTGLLALEAGTDRFRPVPVQGLPEGEVSYLAAAPEGGLWAVHPQQGLYRIRPHGRAWRGERDMPREDLGEITHVVTAPDGAVWVSGTGGVGTQREGRWHVLGIQGFGEDSVPFVLAPRRDGSVWCSLREQRSLVRLVFREGGIQVVERLGPEHPAAALTVFAMQVDREDRLVLGTMAGLVVWDGRRVVRHDARDGWAGEDCSQNALFLDGEDRVWVGTSAGLVHGRLRRQPREPRVEMRILGLEDGQGLWHPGWQENLELPHARRSVRLHLAPVTFPPEAPMRFRVRLLGLEEAWRETDSLDAPFPGLRPGRYTLEATHGEGGPVARMTFTILPPWWQRAWALGLWAGLLWLLLSTLLRWRTALLKRRNAHLEALVQARTAELGEANAALREASLRDPLTGLFNRRYVNEALPLVLEQAVRTQASRLRQGGQGARVNEDLALLLVDLDHFKRINDTLGHGAGDEVLREAARRLRAAFRTTDLVARWGGEEFLVGVARTDRRHGAAAARQAVQVMSETPVCLEDGTEVPITASVGFICVPALEALPEALPPEAYFAVADLCLYAAKAAGRNGYVGVEAFGASGPEEVAARLLQDLGGLVREGRVEVLTSLPDPFGAGGIQAGTKEGHHGKPGPR